MRTRSHGKVGLVALLGGALALTGPSIAAAAGVYGGELRTDDPLVLITNAAGTKLTKIVTGWDAGCDTGNTYAFHGDFKAVAAPKNGFHLGEFDVTYGSGGRFTATYVWGQNLQSGNGSKTENVTVKGRLTRTGASGTLVGRVTFVDIPWLPTTLPDKVTTLDTCRTGSLAWRATRRAGTVYGGSTAQHEPLVVVRNASGTRVTGFHVGWNANCSPDGWVDMPETFTGLSLRGGAFAGALKWTGDQQQVIDYAMAGRLSKTRGTGIYQAKATYPDGHVCDTGRQAWAVSTG